MMERLSFDAPNWSRSEWTQSTGFLMSLAAALNESGIVPLRLLDALRMDLAALQSGVDSGMHDPPLLALARRGNEFIRLIEARYGRDRLVLNMFRHSAKCWMTECSRTLARWGEKTTRNADKVLNRTLIIHRAETGPADERLFSSLLVEFAARIQQCMDAMEDLFSRLDAMHAISFDDNPQANSELEVARKLSFAAVATDTELGREEEYFVRRMAIEIANLSGAISHFASQLSLNSDAAPSILLELRNSWIKTEAIRLFHYTWPGAASLVTGEVSRLHIMMSLHSISSALADVESETSALTPGKIASMPITALRQRTEFVRGALVADAMLAGLDAGEATDAVVAMVAYAEKHDLASHEIIVSELQKIHPSLMPRTLHYFQNLTEIDPVAGKKSSEKSESASRSRTLLDYFSTKSRKLASSPLAMLVLAFVLSASAIGCGLKTATRSDVDDLRPEIPFKNK